MPVNLRDRLYNDTGGPLQNATVQAVLVTGGGTDAGTSSVVQATTTTDVNGVWKFTNLPDAGTGNWYDVKIINGNQVRWRYGNIQTAIQQLLLNSAITVTGLLTANAGLTVAAGNVIISSGTLSFNGSGVSSIVGPGATGASGFLRLQNNSIVNAALAWRGANNAGDLQIFVDSSNQLNITNTNVGDLWATSATATAGTGGAPPAQVRNYISVVHNGVLVKIPAYNA